MKRILQILNKYEILMRVYTKGKNCDKIRRMSSDEALADSTIWKTRVSNPSYLL